MINTHNSMFDELLSEVKTIDDLVQIIKVPYARLFIEQAVNDTFINFDTSSIKISEPNDNRWQAGAYLLSRPTTNIFTNVFLTAKTSQNLKTKQYRALMEMLYVGEAKILTASLNKDFAEIYPTLTHEFICQALNIADDRITAS